MTDPLAHGLPHLVEVRIDKDLHPDHAELDEVGVLTYAVLDTTWKLLREYAVRAILAGIRKEAAERGVTLPSDDELFREGRESGHPDAVTGYLDLAPEDDHAADHLHEAFTLLVEAVREEASAALELGE